jgi:lipid-A-disaccharide synthase
MRYYIIAGEKSGDMHGGRLIQALRQVDKQAIYRGWGGSQMEQAGAELVVHYRELAVMGFNIAKSLFKFIEYLKYCKKDILQFKPDAVILIDYAGFNLRIAKFAKSQGLKVLYYIPPKVWAWNSRRVHQLKDYVDWIYAIFPFEKDFYAQYNCHHVTYVGNPSVEEVALYHQQHVAPKPATKRMIGLLPGSRPQEIRRLLPTMLTLIPHLPDYQFVVAAVSELPQELYQLAIDTPGVQVIYDQTYAILSRASAAIVASGTATLETALFQVPQVVVYQTDRFTYFIAKYLVKLRYISLVNILAGKEVVRELIQHQLTTKNLLKTMEEIIYNTAFRQEQLESYEAIIDSLGEQKASISTAQSIVKHLLEV